MSVARARVAGRFDAAHIQEATVTVDRGALLISVRPLRRRRDYTLPLATVAEMICLRVIRAELAERKRAKAERRRGARR